MGSRLAGDAVGSRLASTGRDVRSQSLNDSARTSYPQPYAKNTGPTTGLLITLQEFNILMAEW